MHGNPRKTVDWLMLEIPRHDRPGKKDLVRQRRAWLGERGVDDDPAHTASAVNKALRRLVQEGRVEKFRPPGFKVTMQEPYRLTRAGEAEVEAMEERLYGRR